MKGVFFLLFGLAAASNLRSNDDISTPLYDSWVHWKQRHGKSYASRAEEGKRLGVFAATYKTIAKHNSLSESSLDLNEFADQSAEEFNVRMGTSPAPVRHGEEYVYDKTAAVPDAVDWRTKNLVNDPKNQGSCGSCWAFSTVVSLEGQHAKANGKLVSLSEQNIVDCVKNVKLGNDSCCDGCKGGIMDAAFTYMLANQNGGDDTESSYPYAGSDGKCAYKAGDVGATFKSFTDVKSADEDALKSAVATVGPISVAVYADMGWQMYKGGIYDGLFNMGCSSDPTKMNHGVAVVGYGSEGGKGYWIVRNSWGATWGEKGYIRLLMGKNTCGVANEASFPNIDKAPAVAAAEEEEEEEVGDIWSNCGSASDHMQDLAITINPNPPQKGTPLNIVLAGTLDEDVTGGSIKVLVKDGFLPILSKTFDLCKDKNIGKYVHCPLAKGPFNMNETATVPKAVPSGSYTAHATITDQSGSEIACVDVKLKI